MSERGKPGGYRSPMQVILDRARAERTRPAEPQGSVRFDAPCPCGYGWCEWRAYPEGTPVPLCRCET